MLIPDTVFLHQITTCKMNFVGLLHSDGRSGTLCLIMATHICISSSMTCMHLSNISFARAAWLMVCHHRPNCGSLLYAKLCEAHAETVVGIADKVRSLIMHQSMGKIRPPVFLSHPQKKPRQDIDNELRQIFTICQLLRWRCIGNFDAR